MNKKVSMTVDLLDKRYKISCEPDEKALVVDASELVNEKYHEIKKHGRTVGPERIATMVALNIASELLKYRNKDNQEEKKPEYDKTLNYLIKRIDNAIDELKQVYS